jgi:hypothetical protein
VCKKVGIEKETISNIGNAKLEELLNYMKKAKPAQKPRKGAKDFPSLGKALRENEGDIPQWRSGIYPDKERGRSVPFVVEAVAFKRRKDEKSHLYPAINFSPNFHEPFKNTIIRGNPSDSDIYDIVEKSGLDVILHLVCPNIRWEDSSKGDFDTTPFTTTVFKVIKDVCKKHYTSLMDTQALIDAANKVLDSHPNTPYSARELHYKLLSTIPEYKNISSDPCATLGKALTIARKTKGDRGVAHRQLDPSRIVDNTRPEFKNNPSYHTFSEYLTYGYKKLVDACDLERWESQKYAVEVWIEKEALSRIIKPVCEKYRVNLFVGKGFSSFTQVYEAVHDRFPRDGRQFVILYFGDHDRSGLKIEDSLKERISAEAKMQGIQIDAQNVLFERCALTYDQIKNENLPSIEITKPEELKISADWISKFGPNKWELDVLEPERLIDEAETWIKRCITDWKAWHEKDVEVAYFKQLLKEKYCAS